VEGGPTPQDSFNRPFRESYDKKGHSGGRTPRGLEQIRGETDGRSKIQPLLKVERREGDKTEKRYIEKGRSRRRGGWTSSLLLLGYHIGYISGKREGDRGGE